MLITQIIGTTAATLTTLAFIPQVVYSYKTRDLSGISLPMYSTFTVGAALWLVYGLLKADWPIIIANLITVILSATILILKIRQIGATNKKSIWTGLLKLKLKLKFCPNQLN